MNKFQNDSNILSLQNAFWAAKAYAADALVMFNDLICSEEFLSDAMNAVEDAEVAFIAAGGCWKDIR